MAASNPPTHENSREGPGRDDHVHITTLLGQVWIKELDMSVQAKSQKQHLHRHEIYTNFGCDIIIRVWHLKIWAYSNFLNVRTGFLNVE